MNVIDLLSRYGCLRWQYSILKSLGKSWVLLWSHGCDQTYGSRPGIILQWGPSEQTLLKDRDHDFHSTDGEAEGQRLKWSAQVEVGNQWQSKDQNLGLLIPPLWHVHSSDRTNDRGHWGNLREINFGLTQWFWTFIDSSHPLFFHYVKIIEQFYIAKNSERHNRPESF